MVRLAKRERSGVQIRSTAFSSAIVPTGQVEKDLDPFAFRSLTYIKETLLSTEWIAVTTENAEMSRHPNPVDRVYLPSHD